MKKSTLFNETPRFIESNMCIMEAKPCTNFGNGTDQKLAYLCKFLYFLCVDFFKSDSMDSNASQCERRGEEHLA